MPELPDVVVYVEALEATVAGLRLLDVRLFSPFVLRSVDPPLEIVKGQTIVSARRLGKRVVLVFGGDLFLVIHLMIAGRLRWRPRGGKPPGGRRMLLAAFVFEPGVLFLTEASSTRRASLQLVRGADALAALDPGGVEPLDADPAAFEAALTRENHTLKRALTDPRLFSGIGNAYSDEILHAARLSPLKLTRSLSAEEIARLLDAAVGTLRGWIDRLRSEARGGFPERVTAFHDEMAVHGRFGRPCRVCGAPIQRIVRGAHECNYCARCQTGGRVLADRALSRLLRDDWPRRLDD